MIQTVTHQTCGSTLYLSTPRGEMSQIDALAFLQKEAYLAGATPTLDLENAGILGETEGPTLYLLRASLKPACRRCGSNQDINENGCCGECQLQEAA